MVKDFFKSQLGQCADLKGSVTNTYQLYVCFISECNNLPVLRGAAVSIE